MRVIIPDVAVHLIQRGNNRAACFQREGDYLLYRLHLRELSKKLACRVHAYCLMTNHIHLLLSPPSAQACSALMKALGQVYAQYFNRTYERTGPLWDGRYRSSLVQSARYVLACYRYIELNPVRAGMVPGAAGYAWSSHRANATGAQDDTVSPHPEFEALGHDAHARRSAYAGLFDSPLATEILDEIRSATNGGYPLASESFKMHFSRVTGARSRPGRPGPKRAAGASANSGSVHDLWAL